MNCSIRTENQQDYDKVDKVIMAAFKNMSESDQSEHLLVKRLRQEKTFNQELSIVACIEDNIVGHILLTSIFIKNKEEQFETLALAPVSVLPKFQKKGIGAQLILEAHRRAQFHDYKSIVLIGHEDYYPRFGYQRASSFDIRFPFEAPDQNCFAIELIKGSLANVFGEVVYPKAFFE